MHPGPVVRARGIVKSFGAVIALDGVDIDIAEGHVHGLVGPNGAGKTTLLGLLLGLAVADSGTLEVFGQAVHRAQALPAGVSGFVDGPGLYPALTARQNLVALASLRGVRRPGVDDILDTVGLTDVADDRVRGFSLGMRQRLGLAAALLTHPRLLVLDEPANGLDAVGTRHVHRVLSRLAADGAAVVMSSHRMDELTALCTEVSLLAAGRVVFSGPVSKLAAETGEIDYRLRTSDAAVTRRLVGDSFAVRLLPGNDLLQRQDTQALLVRGSMDSIEELISGLVRAGVAIRELAPVMSPLETAYLALVGADENSDGDGMAPGSPPVGSGPLMQPTMG